MSESVTQTAFFDALDKGDKARILEYETIAKRTLLIQVPLLNEDPVAFGEALQSYLRLLVLEEHVTQRDFDKDGYDGLGPIAHGKKSEEQLEQGRPFSLGAASHCLVVGVQHPDVGIAGSHKFAFELEKMARRVGSRTKNKNLQKPLIEEAIRKTPDYLAEHARSVTQEACDDFLSLTGGNPIDGASFIVYGVSTMKYNPEHINVLRTEVARNITERGFTLNSNQPFSLDRLGDSVQVVYGGKNHPKFSIPTPLPVQI